MFQDSHAEKYPVIHWLKKNKKKHFTEQHLLTQGRN
jgi:hypothetical protein